MRTIWFGAAVLVVAAYAANVPHLEYAIKKLELENQLAKMENNRLRAHDEDVNLRVPELVDKYGYPVETHYVKTYDGYILTMHRIPHGKDASPKENKGVMFLQHGILSSSADFLLTGAEKGLGYIMADRGYDVWMGNARGNFYSRNHTSLNPETDNDFWQFSWHDIGTIDLPAMIDYVLDVTKEEKLFYTGHSQGTSVFFVMCSERPEYNMKIRAQFSLAPITYMKYMTSPLLNIIALFTGTMDALFKLLGVNEFLPNNEFMSNVGNTLCKDNDITQILCTNALFAICGFSHKQMNATLIPIITGHTPAGASTKQFIHYGQIIRSGHFRRWDYGLLGNMKHYGTVSPPSYDLSKVTAPVYLIYSRNDWLSNEKDVLKLYNNLPNCQGKFLVSDSNWNHLDYVFGIDAPSLVYNKVISLATRH